MGQTGGQTDRRIEKTYNVPIRLNMNRNQYVW